MVKTYSAGSKDITEFTAYTVAHKNIGSYMRAKLLEFEEPKLLLKPLLKAGQIVNSSLVRHSNEPNSIAWVVSQGESGKLHTITKGIHLGCTCLAFKYRGVKVSTKVEPLEMFSICKHTLAIELLIMIKKEKDNVKLCSTSAEKGHFCY